MLTRNTVPLCIPALADWAWEGQDVAWGSASSPQGARGLTWLVSSSMGEGKLLNTHARGLALHVVLPTLSGERRLTEMGRL